MQFQEELWSEFERKVRKGAKFPTLLDVTYPEGVNPRGLVLDTDGRSAFLAEELVADSSYKLKPEVGEEDVIIEFNKVVFLDTDGRQHRLEPDAVDLYWVCQLLDLAE